MPSFIVFAQASGLNWSCVTSDRATADELAEKLTAGGAHVEVSPAAGMLRAGSDTDGVAAAALVSLVPPVVASCTLVLEVTGPSGARRWEQVPGEAELAEQWIEGDEELSPGLVAALALAKGVSASDVRDDLCEDAFVKRRLARPVITPSSTPPDASALAEALFAGMASPAQREDAARAWLAESGYDVRSAHLVRNGYCEVVATKRSEYERWSRAHGGAIVVMPVLA